MNLVVHIGAAKCGSSAIQDFLRDNAALLKEKGFLVPGAELDLDSEVVGHQVWFFERLLEDGSSPDIVYKHLQSLSSHMQESQLDNLIISAENLVNDHRFPIMLAKSRELFDIRLIAYIRRQDDYFASAWQQWFLKIYPSLEAYVDSHLGKDANWAHQLAVWEGVFGRECMTVRRFQRSALAKGNVLDDFVSHLSLPPAPFSRQEGPSNLSFDEHLGMLAHRVRDLFSSEHDNGFYDNMLSVIGPRALKTYSGSILFTLEERKRILMAYDECNQVLKRKYFSDLCPDEPLFEDPSDADVIGQTELEQLRSQQDLLVRAVVSLTKRLRMLEMAQVSQSQSQYSRSESTEVPERGEPDDRP